MGGTYSTNGVNGCVVLIQSLRRSDCLFNPGVDVRIILNLMLRK